MKKYIGILAVSSTFLLAIVLFVFLLFVAATDAQGAVALIIYTPIIFGLPFLTYYFSKSLLKEGNFQFIMRKLSAGFLVFLLAFYISAPIPYLKAFPGAMVSVVAKGFEIITGETPLAWDRRKSMESKKK